MILDPPVAPGEHGRYLAPMRRHLRLASTSPVNLAKNERHLFAASHALRIYRERAIYSFIPKNGCTALRYALAIANGVLRPGDDLRWVHKNNGTFVATLPDLILADYTFIVVRCPYRRLASAFLDKIIGEQGRRDRFVTATGIAETSITFRRFAKAMSDHTAQHADHHWAPQIDFFIYSEYDDIFCLEDFDAMVRLLKDRIDLDVFDVRKQVRHGLDAYTPVDGDFADMPIAEIAAMRREGRSPTAASLYDAGTFDAVSLAYAEDIALHREWSPAGSQLTLD
ncbi:MAG: hypothetical protein EON87_11230 [Brevundimonas sp.]|nr:MAG: hypothetical protein EON87_11230 [Brevundimonas sp.]